MPLLVGRHHTVYHTVGSQLVVGGCIQLLILFPNLPPSSQIPETSSSRTLQARFGGREKRDEKKETIRGEHRITYINMDIKKNQDDST